LLIDDRHRDIARIALAAAGRKYEVAFAGGGALQVHDVTTRRTQDIDLFVRKARNVPRAAGVIAGALEHVGYRVGPPVADERIARELPPGKTPAWVRKALAGWPRQPVHADG
jgi:hypothetical protein